MVVVTNQSVIARGLCTIKELGDIHKKMETELGADGAFVEAIYFCPHHPHGGFEGEIQSTKSNVSVANRLRDSCYRLKTIQY